MKISKILETMPNNQARLEFLILCENQLLYIDWSNILTKYPNLIFQKTYNKNKGMFFIKQIYGRNINKIINHFIKTKNKKGLFFIAKHFPYIIGNLNLTKYKKYIQITQESCWDFDVVNDINLKYLIQKKIPIKQYFIKNNINKYLIAGGELNEKTLYYFLSNKYIMNERIFTKINNDSKTQYLIKCMYKKKYVKEHPFILKKINETFFQSNKRDQRHIKIFKQKFLSYKHNIGSVLSDDFFILTRQGSADFNEEKINTINDFIEQIDQKFKNKGLKRKIKESLKNKDKIISFFSLQAMLDIKKHYQGMDEQLLFPLLTQNYTDIQNTSNIIVEQIMSLFSSPKDFITFFIKSSSIKNYSEINQLLNDTIYMLRCHKEYNNYILPRFKTIKELHDFLALNIKQRNQPLKELNQNLDNLDGIDLGDNLSIKIPKTNHDLISIGVSLKHCVGNGFYSDKIINNKIKIITIYKEDKLYSCIEYCSITNKILQNKGLRNQCIKFNNNIHLNFMEKIQNELTILNNNQDS